MLVWNETDFTACLETVPVVGDSDTSHTFIVADSGLRLELTVFQFDGDVSIRLFRDGLTTAIFDLTMMDCAGARYVNDKNGERLEFAPANSIEGRYDGQSAPPFGVSIAVKPSIQLRFFGGGS